MHLDDEVIASAVLGHEGVDWRIRFRSQAADAAVARHHHRTVPGSRPPLEEVRMPRVPENGDLRTGVSLSERFQGRHGDEKVADARRRQHPNAVDAVEHAAGGHGAPTRSWYSTSRCA